MRLIVAEIVDYVCCFELQADVTSESQTGLSEDKENLPVSPATKTGTESSSLGKGHGFPALLEKARLFLWGLAVLGNDCIDPIDS